MAHFNSDSPFHAGEQAVQRRLGVREQIEPWARKVIRPLMPAEHRAFYEALPYVIAAARDDSGRPWATILAGGAGFIESLDPKRLSIAGGTVAGDALQGAFRVGADVGLLGIELATRRRNRVNGRIASSDSKGIVFEVDQSFGNCPRYISERELRIVSTDGTPPERVRMERLTKAAASQIRSADTFFIATGHRAKGEDVAFGMDASHRGGARGFVEIVDDRTLLIPDYSGNNHFNTIGNLVLDPRAGLLFVDFESGGMLQMTGRTEIDWDSKELGRFPGARRLIRFTLDEAIWLEAALPLRWDFAIASRRELRLVEKKRESVDVFSFVFEAKGGEPLDDFSAGQHLSIEIRLPDHNDPLSRTYSLSKGSDDSRYRISVKRETQGVVSRYLHDTAIVGDIFVTHAPSGDFVLDADLDQRSRPIVLVSVGIGLTPMLSMLHELAGSTAKRPVWFVHGTRDGEHHVLAAEVRALTSANESIKTCVAYTRPLSADLKGRDFDIEGRVDVGLLESILPDLDADYYLCGPVGFMAELQLGLEALGVPTSQIHSESFGLA